MIVKLPFLLPWPIRTSAFSPNFWHRRLPSFIIIARQLDTFTPVTGVLLSVVEIELGVYFCIS
jgi:hypothetical protein